MSTDNALRAQDPRNPAARADLQNPYSEYLAITGNAGILSLPDFGVICIEGPDREAWLHRLTTANLQPLPAGAGTYAFLLNASAHVVADFVLLKLADALWLYSSHSAIDKLETHLRRAIFREHLTLTNLSFHRKLISLQGPNAEQILVACLGDLPSLQPLAFIRRDWNGSSVFLIRNARTAAGGFDVLLPADAVEPFQTLAVERGAVPVGPDALNVARVEAGIPWYGSDYDESILAPEARLDRFIPENKGCYTGQEVIARIRNRGHVNRLLVQLEVQTDSVPERGALILSEGNEVGWITSAVWSYRIEAPVALGYLRRNLVEPGTRVQVSWGQAHADAIVRDPWASA